MPGLPSGTVTFLFTDIEGSTALLQRLGDRRYAEVLAEHRRLLRAAFEEGRGQEVDTQGDAFLVAFSRARDAVGAAVAAQRALTKHVWPDGTSLRVRMALHTGEPVSETGGYVGLDVHRASRICSAGHGGQILLSDAVSGLAARDLPPGVSLRDLGTHRLKDLMEPEHLFQLVHPDLTTDFPFLKSLDALAEAAPRLSIVVLPFASLGKETDHGFADAVVQDLTTDLTHISGSFIIAWTTAASYKGKAVNPQQVGRELGVRYVLEGSVQRAANRVRVNAQLIDAETGYHLWAERIDRELGDLLGLQDEITKRIAGTLNLQLINIEAKRAERNRTSSDAMDYVMRGRVLGFRPASKDNARQEREMYERALQLDARLRVALTGFAGALAGSVLDGLSDEPEADLQRANDLVSQALAIDANDWRAHRVKGQILRAQATVLGMHDCLQQAIVEYETAITLNPIDARAFVHLARTKILIGMPAEAIPLLEQAMRISPRDPDIGSLQHRLGLAHLLLGHTEEAVQWYKKAIPTLPPHPLGLLSNAYVELGAALSLIGDKVAAQGAIAEAVERNPKYTTIANIRRLSASASKDPKWLALREQTIIKGLRQAGVPEQ